jgi:putative ABC transport system ATP-binding protein
MMTHNTHTTRHAVIQTHDLRKVYRMGESEVHALNGVSLEIYSGEMVAITGPSGSGKSTLMAILGALDLPTSGSYRLDGQEVANLNDDALAAIRNSHIGFVFQKFNLLARATIQANVALPLTYSGVARQERMARAEHALRLVGLVDRLHHKPNELSGGQQQRVAIARALVTQPAMVLADEPTGNLDSKTGADIMALFHQLNKQEGITLIIVTHAPEIAEQCQRNIRIRDGQIEQGKVPHATH